MIDAILIAGPTASGKSAIALEMARMLDGTVINADSMQVYRDLAVITARPCAEDTSLAPHRLYGTIDGAVNYSVGHYVKDAKAELDDARTKGKIPIFVGGTGLYFKSLIDGLSEVPSVSDDIREKVRSLAEQIGSVNLHAYLATLDPEGAKRLKPADGLRVQRALEVIEATGKPISSFHQNRNPGLLDGLKVLKVFLEPDRERLKQVIDRRFDNMIMAGALEEVDRLRARHLDPMLPIMRAHGVPGLVDYLNGYRSLEEAIARGQGDTRRYAKRQFTWFRTQMSGWERLKPEHAMDDIKAILARS